MTTDELELGIAGCGWAGRRHGEAICATPGASVGAIADPNDTARNECANSWAVTDCYEDYHTMLDSAVLDGIVIALPHHLHEDASIAAATAGVDQLVEKPIARTVSEADRMLDAAADAGCSVIVAESARYEPWTVAVDQSLAEHEIGVPLAATMNRLADYGGRYHYDRSDWLNDPERLGGGPWLLNGIHAVSVVRSWFETTGAGRAVRVTATDARTEAFDAPNGMEGSVTATIDFESGGSARVVIAVELPHCGQFNDVRLHGTEGTLVVDQERTTVTIHRPDESTKATDIPSGNAFSRQMASFVDHLRSGRETRTSGRRERNSLALIRAGYASIDTGKAIAPEYRTA